jgi:microcystin-dependent protein
MIKKLLLSSVLLAASLSVATPSSADVNPFIGDIMTVGFNFCPRGWAEADGQLLPISSNTALFSLYGTFYGGDGRTTFGLPDFRGRAPVHTGNGPGLSPRVIGSKAGSETVTLLQSQIPNHTHRAAIKTVNEAPNTPSPVGAAFPVYRGNAFHTGTDPNPFPSTPGNPARFMNPENIYVEPTGGTQSHNNMQPYLVMKTCIALVGVYPSRD